MFFSIVSVMSYYEWAMSGPFLIGLVNPKKLLLFSDVLEFAFSGVSRLSLQSGSGRRLMRSMRSASSVFRQLLV